MAEDHQKCLLPFRHISVDDPSNGLLFATTYIPEELLVHILSYVEPKTILGYSLVCRKWNNVIKSPSLWYMIFKREYNRKVAKKLPWYLYHCLLTTNDFQTKKLAEPGLEFIFSKWCIWFDHGKQSVTEDPFNRLHVVKLGQSKLFRHILDVYKPHIYLSGLAVNKNSDTFKICKCKPQWGFLGVPREPRGKCFLKQDVLVSAKFVSKVLKLDALMPVDYDYEFALKTNMLFSEYPEGIQGLMLQISNCNTETWVSQPDRILVSGGRIRVLFDTMEPVLNE